MKELNHTVMSFVNDNIESVAQSVNQQYVKKLEPFSTKYDYRHFSKDVNEKHI